MKLLLIIGIVCVLGVIVIGAVTASVGRAKSARSMHKLSRRVGYGNVLLTDEIANFYGVASRGKSQARGNGCLLLTTDTLVFEQWTPKRVLEIPRARIVDVSDGRSFLGKTRGKRLLKVTWTLPDGTEDRAAWQLRELDIWLSKLRP